MEETRDSEGIKLTTASRDTEVVEVNPPATINDEDKDLLEKSRPPSDSPNEKGEEEPKEFGFSCVVQNWLERDERKMYSKWHEFEGFKWRMLIFPYGNDAYQTLSVYLECAPVSSSRVDGIGDGFESSNVVDQSNPYTRTTSVDSVKNRQVSSLYPVPWRRPAAFRLILRHPDYPMDEPANSSNSMEKAAEHTFHVDAGDWGFQYFAKFVEIKREKYVDQEGSLHLETVIKMVDKVCDLSASDWNSKKETGYVGLKNQGATCYMNSLLQTLYMVGEFRRAVFNLPLPEEDDEKSDISFALQKLFYELQVSPIVVKTKKLTESFGWDTTDAFTQHDVQELNRILCDHLEEKIKELKPARPNTIAELFEGKLLNYIECVDVDYKSRREESFYDLSLNVKGCRNIYDSFNKYTEVEIMDGDNKYRAEGYSELQKARKGVIFTRLPPVLQLHLKRFEYDFNRDTMVKINDRYEFSKELDLSRYVEGTDGTDIYLLHSVLVHIGDVNGGHYHAFIRPTFEDKDGNPGSWLKFDDDIVKNVTPDEAIQNNFGAGGEVDDDLGLNGTNNTLYNGQTPLNPGLQPRLRPYNPNRRFSNAYMLQYVRKGAASKILRETTNEDIPKELFERITREKQEEERRKKERAEQHLYTHFRIATDKDLSLHTGDDLLSFDSLEPQRIKRSMTLGELKVWMQDLGLISDARFVRVWRCRSRANGTVRPYSLLADGVDSMMVTETLKNGDRLSSPLFHHHSTRTYSVHPTIENLYVEDLRSGFSFSPYDSEAEEAVLNNSLMGNIDMINSSRTLTGNAENKSVQDGKGEDTALRAEKVIDQSPFVLGDDEALIFFKMYFPAPFPQLRFLGHAVVSRIAEIREIKKILPKIIRSWKRNNINGPAVNPDAKFMVWEEVTINRQLELKDSQRLNETGVRSNSIFGGDILLFQEVNHNSGEDTFGDEPDTRHGVYNPELPLGGRPLPLAPKYYEYLQLNIKAEFRDKDDMAKAGIVLEILRSDSYETVREILASALDGNVDPNRLRFFAHDGIHGGPRSDATYLRDDDTINQMLSNFKLPNFEDAKIIWYEHTEYDIREFYGKDEVRVAWMPDSGAPGNFAISRKHEDEDVRMEDPHAAKKEGFESEKHDECENGPTSPLSVRDGARTFSVLVPTLSRYGDVLEQVRLKTKVGKDKPLRLLQIKSSKITQILDENDFTQKQIELSYDFGVELRAEPVPPDQTQEKLGTEAILVAVMHVSKEKPRVRRGPVCFGVPFMLRVAVAGEKVADLRERIRKHLGIKEKEFSSWRLGEIRISKTEFLDDENDIWTPCIETRKLEWNSLALEHRSNAPVKRTNTYGRYTDKPLKIRS